MKQTASAILFSLFFYGHSFTMEDGEIRHQAKKQKLELTSHASPPELIGAQSFIGTQPEEFVKLTSIMENQEKLKANGISIPHLIGIYGPHGTGKTTLIEQLGSDLNAKIKYIDGFEMSERHSTQLGRTDSVAMANDVETNLSQVIKNHKKSFQSPLFIVMTYANSTEDESVFLKIQDILKNSDAENTSIFLEQRTTPARSSRNMMEHSIPLKYPKKEDREVILRHYVGLTKCSIDSGFSFKDITARTKRLSPLVLKKIANSAATNAILQNRTKINESDFLEAIELHTQEKEKPNTIHNRMYM